MFPDEFHLYTLSVFLKSCCELQPSVNVKTIVILMINRLTVFTFHNSNASEVKLFEVLTEQIANIIQVNFSFVVYFHLFNLNIDIYCNKIIIFTIL